MANTTLTQTGAQVQADLDKVEGLANIKSVGSGLSLSSAGQLSASGGSSGVTEISTQYIRITDLSAGVYKLTYNGTKYIYYNGSTGTSTHTVGSGSGAVILTIAKYNSSYWTWHYIGGSTTPTIYYGYTSSSSGSVYNDALTDANTNYYPSRSYTSGLQISSYVGTSSCALYVPYATDSQYGVIKTSDIKVTNATVSTTGSGNAVTGVSISDGQIVATKGSTFALASDIIQYDPTTVWSGSVTQSGGSRTLSSLSGASTLDDGIWRITVTYQGATIGITLLIADGKGYGYGGESSMGSYNVYMVGLQYESGTFWARGTTFKGSSNDHSSGSVTDIAFQATITYKKIERLVSF